MLTRSFAIIVLLLSAVAGAACASGWDTPEWTARLGALHTSSPYPGYIATESDQGLRAEVQMRTANRVSNDVKMGFELTAGAFGLARFGESRYGWGRGEVSVRRRDTRLVTGLEWTPRRAKFPATPEDAVFERSAWSLGIRQALGGSVRLKVDYETERDDFVAAFDARDSRARSLSGAVRWESPRGIALSVDGTTEREDAAADKYDFQERSVRAAVERTLGALTLSGGLRSIRRSYDRAVDGDSNFGRRDRSVEASAGLSRRMSPALALETRGTLRNQRSTRADRTYAVGSVYVGLVWGGAR